ncbi:MAG TPA: hypothetical protein VJV74_12185 [Terriglobia bacterium]|nr:hypothetical protein [Terriglobia bacterium]
MAKNFGALRVKMSSAARARATQRAQAMLDEIPQQGVEAFSVDRGREFDEGQTNPAEDVSRRDRSKK